MEHQKNFRQHNCRRATKSNYFQSHGSIFILCKTYVTIQVQWEEAPGFLLTEPPFIIWKIMLYPFFITSTNFPTLDFQLWSHKHYWQFYFASRPTYFFNWHSSKTILNLEDVLISVFLKDRNEFSFSWETISTHLKRHKKCSG